MLSTLGSSTASRRATVLLAGSLGGGGRAKGCLGLESPRRAVKERWSGAGPAPPAHVQPPAREQPPAHQQMLSEPVRARNPLCQITPTFIEMQSRGRGRHTPTARPRHPHPRCGSGLHPWFDSALRGSSVQDPPCHAGCPERGDPPGTLPGMCMRGAGGRGRGGLDPAPQQPGSCC